MRYTGKSKDRAKMNYKENFKNERVRRKSSRMREGAFDSLPNSLVDCNFPTD